MKRKIEFFLNRFNKNKSKMEFNRWPDNVRAYNNITDKYFLTFLKDKEKVIKSSQELSYYNYVSYMLILVFDKFQNITNEGKDSHE